MVYDDRDKEEAGSFKKIPAMIHDCHHSFTSYTEFKIMSQDRWCVWTVFFGKISAFYRSP
jgi:hypothetical protein